MMNFYYIGLKYFADNKQGGRPVVPFKNNTDPKNQENPGLADKAKNALGNAGNKFRNMSGFKKAALTGGGTFIAAKIARKKRIKDLRAAHPDWSEAQIRAAAGGSNALGKSLLVAGGVGLANKAVQKGWLGKDLASDENRRKLELKEAQKKKDEEKAQAEHEAKLKNIQGN